MSTDTAPQEVGSSLGGTSPRIEPSTRIRRSRNWWTGSVATFLLMVPTGCDKGASRGASPTFQERQAQRPWATATSLEEGGRLHRERCLTCHGQAPRELYPPARWREIVDAMSERSRLDTVQARLVLDWILVGDSLGEGFRAER